MKQISAYAEKLYICSRCAYSPEIWTLLQLNAVLLSHRQTAPSHCILRSSQHTPLPGGLQPSWCWNNRFVWMFVCVHTCVTNTVLPGQPRLETWTVSQGTLDDSEMNNNELAECQVQHIRDEPESRSTAIHSCLACIIVSACSGNISIWAEYRAPEKST